MIDPDQEIPAIGPDGTNEVDGVSSPDTPEKRSDDNEGNYQEHRDNKNDERIDRIKKLNRPGQELQQLLMLITDLNKSENYYFAGDLSNFQLQLQAQSVSRSMQVTTTSEVSVCAKITLTRCLSCVTPSRAKRGSRFASGSLFA